MGHHVCTVYVTISHDLPEAGEMAQWAKCSQLKHLSLEPRHPNKSCEHWQAPVTSALGAVWTGGLRGLPSQLVQPKQQALDH